MPMIDVTLSANNMAYISLCEIKKGGVAYSVPLESEELDPDAETLDRFVLDFDKADRLIGIEVLGFADKVLPESLLAEAERI